jgi:hypothetical protein
MTIHHPWPSLSITITRPHEMKQRSAGFFDLELTAPSHDVPRVSFPMLGSTPLDADPALVALLPMLGGIFIQSGAGCYQDCMDDDVMDYPGGVHAHPPTR